MSTHYTVSFNIKNLNGQLLRAGDIHASTMNRLVQNFSNTVWLIGISSAECVSPRTVKWEKDSSFNIWRSEKFNVQNDLYNIEYRFIKTR